MISQYQQSLINSIADSVQTTPGSAKLRWLTQQMLEQTGMAQVLLLQRR